MFSEYEVVSLTPNPKAGGPLTLGRLSTTAYLIYSELTSISGGLLPHPQPKGTRHAMMTGNYNRHRNSKAYRIFLFYILSLFLLSLTMVIMMLIIGSSPLSPVFILRRTAGTEENGVNSKKLSLEIVKNQELIFFKICSYTNLYKVGNTDIKGKSNLDLVLENF